MTVDRLGARLKELRDRRDLSQQELASDAGVAVRTVSRIESGATEDVKLSTFVKLADALGVALVVDMVEPARGEVRPRAGAVEPPARTLPAQRSDSDEPELRAIHRRQDEHVEYVDQGDAEVIQLTARVKKLASAKQAHLVEPAVTWLGRMRRQDQSRPYTDEEIRRALREVAP